MREKCTISDSFLFGFRYYQQTSALRSEGKRWNIWMEKISKVGRRKTVQGLVGEWQHFEICSNTAGQPAERWQHWSNMVVFLFWLGYEQWHLQASKTFCWQPREEHCSSRCVMIQMHRWGPRHVQMRLCV